MTIRTLIVDDEPLARQRLQRFLEPASDIQLLPECGDGKAAVAAIQEHEPDLVFLDVQMPHLNGFEVLSTVGVERIPVVIFVTAFDAFALQAFEAQALDYLLKPFGQGRVQQALERARTFLEGNAKQSFKDHLAGLLRTTEASGHAARVLVRNGNRMLVVGPAEIDWVEAYGDYVRLHVGQQSHLLRSTLTDMEQRLRPEGFARIHRSRLVNLERIKEFITVSPTELLVVLKNDVRLNASPTFLRDLQRRLGADA
ncbi:LytR/AlgR family response regulator transcription factor [Steroidobacter cummioxidans]|uniref:LytR/AlgR family response regulator transcription factor n=1 Tax=Steroidobacter cummioxidans TaxID=1803913 RepID=UPI000E322045|nr:LytTR family DNA-binding domain-containing protein [Steroidobacter cummioxidans]